MSWEFLEGRITETVATTLPPNVAPMGLLKDGGTVYARLWEGSDTLENVRVSGEVTVNFTRDPVVYVRGALGDPGDELMVDGRLEEADAWFRCGAEHVGSDGEVERWELRVMEGEVLEERLFTVNRGFNSVIEAAVHATRLGFKPELRELVDHHVEVARKCGGEREREAVDLLMDFIDD